MTAELIFLVLIFAAEKSKYTFLVLIGVALALFFAMKDIRILRGASVLLSRAQNPTANSITAQI